MPRHSTVAVEAAVDQGTNPRAPSRQSSPVVVVMTVPSKWRSDETGDVEGKFQPHVPAKQMTLPDTGASLKDESHCQGTTAFRSRFFPVLRIPSPDPPLPPTPQIPDANEQSLQEFLEVPSNIHADFSERLSGGTHRQVSPYALEKVADDPQVAHSPLPDGYMSLGEHTMNAGAIDDPIYPPNSGLTVAHFIDEHLGTEGYFDAPTDDRLDSYGDPVSSLDAQCPRELVEKHGFQQDRSAPGLQWDSQYCGPFSDPNVGGSVWRGAVDWEDTMRWNDDTGVEGGSYEFSSSHSQHHRQTAIDETLHHDGFTPAGVDHEMNCQDWSTTMITEEKELQQEGQYEGSTGYEGQAPEEEDVMLEFSEGRTLLMGMGDGILAEEPSRKLGTRKLHPKPYRVQFGQSVDEIEVMVGKNFGNLWKR